MAGSGSETESSIQTEPSAGDAEREAYEPFRTAAGKPAVHAFRQWWLRNPVANLWGSAPAPNQWQTFQRVAAGADPAEAVKGGAHVTLDDIRQSGPTADEVLAAGGVEVEELPSDEAWFGRPDPDVYADGTNHLTKQQLAEEVDKGNVVTLRQLRQHLEQATDDELQLWAKVLAVQHLQERAFVPLPGGGRASVWDLYCYVKHNPELRALAERDPNLAVPAGGMTREERIRALADAAPWKLCANERRMVLPPSAARKLPWGLLAGGSWYSRRPTRWLKGLDGVKDFDYGLYVHEAAAEALMGEDWAGRAPGEVLGSRAFYRDALGLAPRLGMSILAVASRPLQLDELAAGWEERLRQQVDRLSPPPAGAAGGQVLLSTSSSAATASVSASADDSASASGSASASEEDSSSSEAVMGAAAARHMAAAPKQAAAPPPPPPHQQRPPAAAPQQSAPLPPPPLQQQQQQQKSPLPAPQQQQQQQRLAPVPAAAPAAAAAAAAPPAQRPAPQPADAPQPAAHAQAALAPVREVDPRYAGLAQLAGLFERERLAAGTKLLDRRGLRLREGASVIFSAHPSGSLLVQAMSPGLVKDQESYVLGSVHDPQLCRALLSLFMDPDATIDPGFTAAAGQQLLCVVNGARTGLQQAGGRGSQPWLRAGVEPEAACRRLLRRAKWSLPDVGKAPGQAPLVKGVRRELMYSQIEDAFESALRAAAAAEALHGDEDGGDATGQLRAVFARRQAAEAELKARLGALGLNVSGLVLPPPNVPADLLSLARPLAPVVASTAAAVAGGR